MQGQGLPTGRVKLFHPTFYKRIIRTEREEFQTNFFFDDAIETPDSLVVAVMIEPPHSPMACANMLVELEDKVYHIIRWVGDYFFAVRHDAEPVDVEYEIHPD